MNYRTKTYIAGEWDGDKDAIQKLHDWNDSKHLSLSFTDAHDLTQARDGSLNCSIKSSLNTRLNASKTFVLIVGSNTKTARSGRCQYCASYNSWTGSCARGHSIDNKSYIEYECNRAVEDKLKIVVLYNAASVDKSKCPDVIRNVGEHVAMCTYENGSYYWNYQAVKKALS
ncbi:MULTISPECIES: TIR domain-containing protein [Enterobacterales]|uniref:Thoeris protein ThsB TIR-like domain-containing protein n=4 Tax=Escherichia coli TaxID=562 RepID=A0A2S1PQY1_ECOLX|nr:MULTISPECIES: TIR domain-containing protein [Enterobacteriaceae]EBI2834371.1 molecular chaperone Tir [Salmonella enterica]EIF3751550.1 molecular chaperone Tir [Salmonella enterica subsp. enterica serovar Ouakam]MCF0257864.1 molecular chaperone Tir [Bacteroides heparinolyticus]MJC78286.1 molecular chaperone Tir [Shigella flexneri]AQV76953.1 molecular chaperone Tir [Escherichia coli]